jgi:hypothetical protein
VADRQTQETQMTTTSPRHSLLVAAAALALAPAAVIVFMSPSAAAQTPSPVGVIEARVSDAGEPLPVLQARIAKAARDVCAKATTRTPLDPRAQTICRKAATSDALEQLATLRGEIAIAIASAN